MLIAFLPADLSSYSFGLIARVSCYLSSIGENAEDHRILAEVLMLHSKTVFSASGSSNLVWYTAWTQLAAC